jgi:hypothetical protein
MSAPDRPAKPAPPPVPLWRQAFDAADRAVAPRAESLVRSEAFDVGVAIVQRAQGVARNSLRGLTARAWHLLNLPAGSDVSRLRAQIGALDREVRRLTVQLETERRRGNRPATETTATTPRTISQPSEDHDGERAQSAGRTRAGTTRRRAQHAPGS